MTEISTVPRKLNVKKINKIFQIYMYDIDDETQREETISTGSRALRWLEINEKLNIDI